MPNRPNGNVFIGPDKQNQCPAEHDPLNLLCKGREPSKVPAQAASPTLGQHRDASHAEDIDTLLGPAPATLPLWEALMHRLIAIGSLLALAAAAIASCALPAYELSPKRRVQPRNGRHRRRPPPVARAVGWLPVGSFPPHRKTPRAAPTTLKTS